MLTVASVPAAHPYVRSVVDTSRVRLLPDPVPACAVTPGQWWPPRLLDPAYLFRHVGSFDVMHVHFGFEASSLEALREVVANLDRNGVPLVVTVHDLHNPHIADPTLHLAQLDVLVHAASVVITLTRGAAAEISERWGVEALVLPHPHVLPLGAVGMARPPRHAPVVAVHGKGLRANISPWPIVDALLEGQLADCSIRFDLDDEGLAIESSAARVEKYRQKGVDVRVHPRFTDAELVEYLTAVDIVVLPYRFGTHSGWLEACYDAGATVVAPDCGFFSEQHPCLEFGYGERLNPTGLQRAVAAGLASVRGGHCEDLLRRKERTAQSEWVRDSLTHLYHRTVASVQAA